jgi:hypothetical protein
MLTAALCIFIAADPEKSAPIPLKGDNGHRVGGKKESVTAGLADVVTESEAPLVR